MTTLTAANEIRIERARLKDLLRSGLLSFEDALDEPAFATMLLFDLLAELPPRRAWTVQRAEQLFREIQRPPGVRVGQLSTRERDVLVYAHFRFFGSGRPRR